MYFYIEKYSYRHLMRPYQIPKYSLINLALPIVRKIGNEMPFNKKQYRASLTRR